MWLDALGFGGLSSMVFNFYNCAGRYRCCCHVLVATTAVETGVAPGAPAATISTAMEHGSFLCWWTRPFFCRHICNPDLSWPRRIHARGQHASVAHRYAPLLESGAALPWLEIVSSCRSGLEECPWPCWPLSVRILWTGLVRRFRVSGGDIGGRTSLGYHRTWASLLPGVAGDRRFRGRVGVALRA